LTLHAICWLARLRTQDQPMTYPFRFAHVDQPSIELAAVRQWGGLTVRLMRASAGRHPGPDIEDHRVVFYTAGPVRTECACDSVVQRRLQTAGDFDIIPARYAGCWEDEEPTEMLSVRMAPELLCEAAVGLGAPGGRAELAPRLGARDPLIAHVVWALAAELAAPSPATRLYTDSLGMALASRLLQDFSARGWRMRQTLSKPQLRRLVDYVEANLEAELTLAELAAVAGVSVPHLTTLFRRTLGRSVHRYVVERRVQRARSLLLAGERSIAQVALETGFAHQSHLARWMKRLLGVTPAELRRDA
jgi:AraC family transcriptional regulator